MSVTTRSGVVGRAAGAGTQAGPHERALAAARRAEHGEEARGAQPLDQARDLAIPAEEQIGVLLAEGLEAAVGAGLRSGAGALTTSGSEAPTARIRSLTAWGSSVPARRSTQGRPAR